MDIDLIPLVLLLEREDVKRVLQSAYDKGATDERRRAAGLPTGSKRDDERRRRHDEETD